MLVPAGANDAAEVSNTYDAGVSVDGAIGAAAATVSDVAGFCDRNSAVCDTGAEAFKVFVAKAENAARLAYRVVAGDSSGTSGNGAANYDGEARDASLRRSWSAPAQPSDTLRSQDLGPAWQGPRSEAI